MRIFFYILLIICHQNVLALFEYDRAISKAQNNDWKTSKELLQNTLINNPENHQVLYDLGVSSYKINEFNKALFYFKKAAESPDKILQEKAYFNAGNTHVSLQELPQAIESYDKALALNPHNEHAAHNKEIVKKMMEEQKKQQDKEQQDKKNKNQNEKDDSKNNQNNKDNNQDQNDQKENNEQQENKPEDNNQSNKDNTNKQPDDQQKQNEQQNNNQKKKDQDEKLKQQSQSQQEKKDTQQTEHNNETENQRQDQSPEQSSGKLPAAMARMLNEQEKKDAQLNKQLLKANAQMPGESNYDCNYW